MSPLLIVNKSSLLQFLSKIRKLADQKFGDRRTALRFVSFNGRDSEPVTMTSHGSGRMMLEGSLRNSTSDVENKRFSRSISPLSGDNGDLSTRSVSLSEITPQSLPESGDQRHLAAVKLQKVYKSFRTRRQLADCAVIAEQRWWKLLDFAELKRSSISFFDIEGPETAFSRWSRARMRAAKVGKGLSKDEKARKLALQHWLEAIDPRHRYGHNLQFYYVNWLRCESKQPFFYWLDIGEGKEVNLDRCARPKLQQQCIKYLGPTERKAYEVLVENGKFIYKQSGKLIDTREGPEDAKWIFVLSTSKILYIGQKNKGTFQHSSFLAGGATLSAGRLIVEDGVMKAVWPHSGHYLPTEENFQEFMSFLREHNVDLADVKKSPAEDQEEAITKEESENVMRKNQFDVDLTQETNITIAESLAQETLQQDSAAADVANPQTSKLSRGLLSRITKLEIPPRHDMLNIFKREAAGPSSHPEPPTSPVDDGYETGYETTDESLLTEEDFIFPKTSLFTEDEEDEDEEPIPKEKIMKRIDSHKGTRSYQLAKQLCSKWTTGAGPRIGCMKDYPSELRSRILEHANLSPRSRCASATPRTVSRFGAMALALTPTTPCRERTSRSPLGPDQVVLSQTATP